MESVPNSAALGRLLRSCEPGSKASKWGLCLLLLTPKRETSALYKSLALRYRGKVVLGEARGAALGSGLAAELSVERLPALLAFCGGSRDTVMPYTGGREARVGARGDACLPVLRHGGAMRGAVGTEY